MSIQNRKLDKENRKLLRQQLSPLGSSETSHKSASAKVKKKPTKNEKQLWNFLIWRWFYVTVKQEKVSKDDEQPNREDA